jgi:hypothetical protein
MEYISVRWQAEITAGGGNLDLRVDAQEGANGGPDIRLLHAGDWKSTCPAGNAMVARTMKFIRLGIMALLLVSISSIRYVVAAPEADRPVTVVQALYRISLDHFTGFTSDSVKLTKPWVAPELYARLWKKVNQPQPKNAAPDIEGDLFLDCQEPPTKFEVGKSSIQQTKAKVDVVLIWPGEKRIYTVLLEHVDGGWKVYDVHYGKDGNLTDLL